MVTFDVIYLRNLISFIKFNFTNCNANIILHLSPPNFLDIIPTLHVSAGSGMLEFEEFVTLAAKFIIEDDAEAMAKELKEAFRLYDKGGKCNDRRSRGLIDTFAALIGATRRSDQLDSVMIVSLCMFVLHSAYID